MNLSKAEYDVNGKTAIVSMNCQSNLNAFDGLLLDELVKCLNQAEKDTEVKVVVIKSSIRAFSAGGDIGAMYKGINDGDLNFAKDIAKMASVSMAMKKLSKPVICAVNGAAAGAGFNVALAADFCIASSDATFIQAFVNIGLVPDAGGFYLMTRSLGVNKATELAMTGRPVSAEEAKDLGFVAKVVEPDQLESATRKVATRFENGPATSFAEMKRLLWESSFSDFEEYIAEEVKSQTLCGNTNDFKEGVSAFVEKRKAHFA